MSTTTMSVTKRNGNKEPVDLNKILAAITKCALGLDAVDSMRVATKTISGLYDGATTEELDKLSIETAASLIIEEPQYSTLASRLLLQVINKEVERQEILSFSQSILAGRDVGRINSRLVDYVKSNARKLNKMVTATAEFEYFGLRTVYDRYLIKHPTTRKVIETPAYFFMRVASALTEDMAGTAELYRVLSNFEYIPSSPTLFNAGTTHEQLASCFLLDSPKDELKAIYEKLTDVAMLSKFSGGIGVSISRVRSRGSLIKSTNGFSSGTTPWLKVLDQSVAAVNQGGKRKGAACVYLETWHADVEEFLELRDNVGDQSMRTYNLNLANWVPDLFMKRVEQKGMWSLFDPKVAPELVDLYGEAFEIRYAELESKKLYTKQMPAQELYARMMKTLAETGNGWMTWKDPSNLRCNQTGESGETVHLSNLCTEILEVNDAENTSVCNIGSINLANHIIDIGGSLIPDHIDARVFDFDKLERTVRAAVRQLNRTVDLTMYNIESAKRSNEAWRPIGLGLMGLQDVFFKLRLPFDSPDALQLSTAISERVYLVALETSMEIAEKQGTFAKWKQSRAYTQGVLQQDLWPNGPSDAKSTVGRRWLELRNKQLDVGFRNSLLIAIAPTATIASILGCYECIEPQVSNLFKRETLSGDFVQLNSYLVQDLKKLGLWTDEVRAAIQKAEGSVQGLLDLPEDIRKLYRTAWELPMKSLIDLAAARGPYIDQGQSLNLFMESPTIGKLSSMYFYAWKSQIKTTYYLRSRAATKIASTTFTPAEAVSCSLENPEACEACQ